MNNISAHADTKQMIKVHMVSLGCAKNLVDSEAMCSILVSDNFLLTDDPSDAQVIVVNTCGFIESAKKEAISKILEMADYKKSADEGDNPLIYDTASDVSPEHSMHSVSRRNCDYLVVAGCLAQRYSVNISETIPEVDAIIGTSEYGSIAQIINELYARSDLPLTGDGAVDAALVRTEKSLSLKYLTTTRIPSTRGFAYLKVAEGCSNCCNYCAIPGIRGAFRSRPMPELISEARSLADMGYYEIVLIAQDTTRYGTDIYGARMLPELIHEISAIPGIRKIRILYCYSDGVTPELIDEMKNNPKVAAYIEMPIQHASDGVLERMNRRDTARSIEQTIQALRQSIPAITIRTTVLVGFPGETDDEFEELYSFIGRMKFDLLGCFVFSAEEGTPAFKMRPKVPKSVALARYHRIMELQRNISLNKNMDIKEKKIRITVESIADDGIFYLGRSDAQAPEIDPPVYVAAADEALEFGKEYNVRIVDFSDYELIGVIIK
ncbi:MAG: MiaB/RimO family radical SAM methylthiotransferase [Saccharofermentanales bacterium]